MKGSTGSTVHGASAATAVATAPPPGQPVDKPYDDKNLKIGEKVEDLKDEVALSNFRVMVIKPDEVESVDLSDPKASRRQVYKFDAKTKIGRAHV